MAVITIRAIAIVTSILMYESRRKYNAGKYNNM